MFSLLWHFVCTAVSDIITDWKTVMKLAWPIGKLNLTTSLRLTKLAFSKLSNLLSRPSAGHERSVFPVRLLPGLLLHSISAANMRTLLSYSIFNREPELVKTSRRRHGVYRAVMALALVATLVMPTQALSHALATQPHEGSSAHSDSLAGGTTGSPLYKSTFRNLMFQHDSPSGGSMRSDLGSLDAAQGPVSAEGDSRSGEPLPDWRNTNLDISHQEDNGKLLGVSARGRQLISGNRAGVYSLTHTPSFPFRLFC
eukprot:GHVS01072262.1.p1 GENE.GHVS01072262.1~~GHVS01072262.1.p1  ORF type:complete len:255 (-),score=13.34 GHVS01072262.1:449-1213(-)